MPKLFISGIVLFLLLGAGYGILQAARATPWDCSDWQAFAHDDRTTAILESLAENRGKTLYCGIDQSDTFGKAETWEAGKDRNERDDTVYFGERGSFRGFIAAQEGWLTEGESGITGQSEATIFEFPKEERRIRRVKRFTVGYDPDQFPINARASCGPVLGLVCSNPAGLGSAWGNNHDTERGRAIYRAAGARQVSGPYYFKPGWTGYRVSWDTNLVYTGGNWNDNPDNRGAPAGAARPTTDEWRELVAELAGRACRARGARYAAGSAEFGRGHSENVSITQKNLGPYLGIFWWQVDNPDIVGTFQYNSRQSRTWTATCKKVIRRNR